MDENPSIPRLQERLKNLDLWMSNPEYQAFLDGTQKSIDGTKESILVVQPVNLEKTALAMKLFGMLDVLSENLKLFVNVRADLEQQLSNLLDEATKTSQKPEENE